MLIRLHPRVSRCRSQMSENQAKISAFSKSANLNLPAVTRLLEVLLLMVGKLVLASALATPKQEEEIWLSPTLAAREKD